VVGAEHVSFSAIATLAHGGAQAVGMVTELPRHQSLEVFRAGAALRYRVPLWTRTAVSAVHGHARVEEVELTDLDSGRVRHLACDIVVFSADWVPDHELAVRAGLALDPATRGPAVDSSLRTSRPGTFAGGNVLHGAETADVAALGGRHAAAGAAGHLAGSAPWPDSRVPVLCEAPLFWIVPNLVGPADEAPARGRFALRSRAFLRLPQIGIEQDGRLLWRGRLRRLVPGRSARLPHAWTREVNEHGGPVRVSLAR
jgi:hypothetical protein